MLVRLCRGVIRSLPLLRRQTYPVGRATLELAREWSRRGSAPYSAVAGTRSPDDRVGKAREVASEHASDSARGQDEITLLCDTLRRRPQSAGGVRSTQSRRLRTHEIVPCGRPIAWCPEGRSAGTRPVRALDSQAIHDAWRLRCRAPPARGFGPACCCARRIVRHRYAPTSSWRSTGLAW
jgi:hypothetical protein